MASIKIPEENTVWKHDTSGMEYVVIMVGNEKATLPAWSPITVGYIDQNGDKWTRPLEEFLERCSEVSSY